MDGCHIYIRAPQDDPEAYINRKQRHSVVLQAVVNHAGKFTDVLVGNVGRDHDAHVLRCSNIFDAMDAGVWVPGNPTLTIDGVTIPALIVADSAYPVRTWLMPPHGGAQLTPDKRHFNRVHSRAHCVVERAFGRLKARWRCLLQQLYVMEENVNPVICACVILHNVCEWREFPPNPLSLGPHHAPIPRQHDPPQVVDDRQAADGEKVRKALTTWLFRQQRDMH